MSKVRVVQSPVVKPMKNGRLAVREIKLDFNTMGAGRSCMHGGDSKPAELKFFASYFESAREQGSRDKKEFAKISGIAKLEAGKRIFQFIFDDKPIDEQIVYSSALSEKVDTSGGRALRRSVKLTFADPKTCESLIEQKYLELLLPDEAQVNAGHLEIHSAFVIDGDEEAESEENDVVDVPLYPLLDGQVVFVILDSRGEPMAGAKALIKHPAGEEKEETADDDGELHFNADMDDEYQLIKLISEDNIDEISQLQLERMRPDGARAQA